MADLTDEQLADIAYKGFDDYWTEDCPGKDSEAWTASAKAVIAALARHPYERPAPAGQAVGERIDAAAEALSKVLAFVPLHAYEDEVSRALAGLRAVQSLATSQAERTAGREGS